MWWRIHPTTTAATATVTAAQLQRKVPTAQVHQGASAQPATTTEATTVLISAAVFPTTCLPVLLRRNYLLD